MQQWGNSYWETYSPVGNMISVRIIIAISIIHNIHSKSIGSSLAFPQADLEEDIWMQLPIRFQVSVQTELYSESHYILKLNKNLYGLNQGSYNWYEKIKKYLVGRVLNPSEIDPCLYIRKSMIVLTYVD